MTFQTFGGAKSYLGGGASSRPMAWNGGGSTKPPMAYNYIDSHGLNAGLGNSATTSFPAVYDSNAHASPHVRRQGG